MSVLTLLADALLVAVLLWLIRHGALGHARERWLPRAKAHQHGSPHAVRVRLDDVDRVVVAHRPTARRWDDVRPGREVLVLEAAGEVLRLHRAADGAIVLEAERDVAVVGERSIDTIGEWQGGAPEWVAAPQRGGLRGDDA